MWLVLFSVGLLGVVVGVLAPERAVEPSLGVALLIWSARIVVEELRMRRAAVAVLLVGGSMAIPASSSAQTVAAPSVARPAPRPKQAPSFTLTPTGYVEAYYAYNLARPSNGITHYRGFDNRHDTFTLSNAALGTNWSVGPVSGRVMLQVGSTPNTYYAGEPALPGASGTNGSSAELWKYLQEAFVAYKAPIGRGLQLQLGLVASPIGFESFAVKDNWNWSRSNLFFGFPFYHTGLRATYELSDHLSATVSLFNGWNSVVDNNSQKSIQSNVTYKIANRLTLQALYFGGVERSTGSAEGPYWRHHFDAIAQLDATSWLSLAAQVDNGWEPNRLGTARWTAGALYARFKPVERVYLSVRGDRFQEHLATAADGTQSAPLFWGGSKWVSSATLTIEVRPVEQISVRLEGRHDASQGALFFSGTVAGAGSDSAPFLANSRTQDTLLLGATAWF